jgi:hypothetical protein
MYTGQSAITLAAYSDVLRIVGDKGILNSLGAECAELVYIPSHTYYLIQHKNNEMILDYKYHKEMSTKLGICVGEVHIACPHKSIKSVRIMCNDIMEYLGNLTEDARVDIIITECTAGTVANTANKLNFSLLEINSKGKYIYMFPVFKLRK